MADVLLGVKHNRPADELGVAQADVHAGLSAGHPRQVRAVRVRPGRVLPHREGVGPVAALRRNILRWINNHYFRNIWT